MNTADILPAKTPLPFTLKKQYMIKTIDEWFKAITTHGPKLYLTIRMMFFDQAKLLAETRKEQDSKLINPLTFFLITTTLLFTVVRYTPLTHSFAAWYAPWKFAENEVPQGVIPPDAAFVLWTSVAGLFSVLVFSWLSAKHNRKLIRKLLLYILGMMMSIKLVYLILFPIILRYIFQVDVSSSISAAPWHFYFSWFPYYLFASLIAYPMFCKEENALATNLIPYFQGRFKAGIGYAVSLLLIMSSMILANLLMETGNKRLYAYYEELPTNQTIGFASANMDTETLEFQYQLVDKDSSRIEADLLVYALLPGSAVPLAKSNAFTMLDNDISGLGWKLSHSYFRTNFNKADTSKQLSLKQHEYYPMHIEAIVSNKLLGHLMRAFNNRITEVGIAIFRQEVGVAKLHRTKRVISIIPMEQYKQS